MGAARAVGENSGSLFALEVFLVATVRIDSVDARGFIGVGLFECTVAYCSICAFFHQMI